MKFNLGIVLAIVMVAIAGFLVLPSCQPIRALFDDREMTREQVNATQAAKEKAAAEEAIAKEKKAQDDIRLAQELHDREVRAVERAYQGKVRDAGVIADQTKAAATDEYQATLDAVGAKFVGKVAEVKTNLAADLSASERALAASKSAAEFANREIDAGEARRAQLFKVGDMVINNPLVATAASAVPGGSGLLTLLGSVIGLGGVGAAVVSNKKTGEARAEANKSKKSTQSIVRGLNKARAADPELKAAMKRNAGLILTEVTDDAHAVIESAGMDPTT